MIQILKKSRIKQLGNSLTMTLCATGLLLSSFSANAERLNVRDADIREVVETVAKITGKTMIVDPRVKGLKVTIITAGNVDYTKDQIYNIFVSALQVHKFQAIEANGVVKIVPDQQARSEYSPVNVKNLDDYGDRYITQVIPVQNVDAQQIMNVLRPLVSPTSGHLFAVQGTNTLILHDSASNVRRISEIIDRTDKANDEEIEVIPLEHASASEIVRILESLNKGGRQQQGNEIQEPRYVADERTNSILLSANDRQRVRLRALIGSLDRPLNSMGNTKTVFLKYAKADQVAEVLSGIGEIKQKEEAASAGRGAGGGGAISSQRSLYSIQPHEETNALVLTAPPDIMREFDSVIRALDIRRKQVHVEAIIVEISDNKAKELGIQWLFSPDGSTSVPGGVVNFTNTGPGIGQVAAGAIAARGTEEEVFVRDPETGVITGTETIRTGGDNGAGLAEVLGGMQGLGLGVARIRPDGFSWGAFIRALEGVTDSNTLSRPSVTTLDNVEAIFKSGQEIPIITGSTLGDNNSNPFQNVERKDVGVMLKLTPQINEGNYVRLDIEQEVSSIAGSTNVDVVTNKREVKTSVLVPDGGMVVLGGLIDDDIQQSSQKVPILGDIPVLGHAFKSQRTQKIKRNLMIFIHPTVLKDDKELQELSSAKYSYIRAQQIEQANRGISLMPEEEVEVLPTYDEALVLPPTYEEYMQDGSLEQSEGEEAEEK